MMKWRLPSRESTLICLRRPRSKAEETDAMYQLTEVRRAEETCAGCVAVVGLGNGKRPPAKENE